MPRTREERVKLPENWWIRLKALVGSKLSTRCTNLAVADFLGVGDRSLGNAKRDKEMTAGLLLRMAAKLGYKNPEDLLHVLNGGGLRSRPATPIPSTLSLKTQWENPQGVD